MTPRASLAEGTGQGEDAWRAAQLAQEWEVLGDLSFEHTPGEQAYSASLASLASEVPEIAENATAIEQHGKELIRTLDISPELFGNRANTLFLSALSQRSARLEERKGEMTTDAYTSEKTFIFDSAVLLAGRRSGRYNEMRDLIDREDTVPEATVERVYDRFTNRQVTADMQKAIENGLFNQVRERLGIQGQEDEDPYVLRVLNVASPPALYGMNPGVTVGATGDLARQELEDVYAFVSYKEGLLKNSQEFLRQTGREDVALAWAIVLEGKRHLCVALPTAEKLLYTDQKRSPSYASRHHAEEQAIAEHEYAHTQGESLMPDRNIFYGLSFEERRAEMMSGNKQGYEDAKGFIDIDLALLTGIDYRTTIIDSPRGGSASKFYVELAKRIGLQSTLEVALVVPEKYLEDTRPMQKQVNQYLGGYNGVLRHIYETAPPERKERIDRAFASWAADVRDKPNNETWRKNRKALYGLHYVTDRLEQAVAETRSTDDQSEK